MTKRMPPPFTPLSSVARSALPNQIRKPVSEDAGEIIEAVQQHRSVNPVVTIIADVTIPQTAGYAKRLNNLLRSLQASLEEEAPWLANIEIRLSIQK